MFWVRSDQSSGFHRVIMGGNAMNTLASSFLIGSSSFLQVTRTCMEAETSSKFGLIPSLTTELAALEGVKNRCIMLR